MSSWYAIYTKPRAEKKVAERLVKRNWDVYCPLRVEFRQWSDRKKKVEVPYFPSYIFINLDSYEKHRSEVLQDPALLNFVFWQGKPAVIPDEEMNTIKEFLHDHDDQSIEVTNYKIGDEITIDMGPLSGLNGVVKSIEKNRTLLVIPALECQLVIRTKKTS